MQYIAFDLGNVLVDLEWQPFFHVLDELGIDQKEMDAFLKLNCRSEFCGLTTFKQNLNQYFNEFETDKILEAWNIIIRPHDQMVNFVESLKYEGVKIAYLSNMGFEHIDFLRTKFPDFMKLADIQHISCEVGAAKPTLLYYQSFLLQHNEFAGSLYLDDLKENILAGSKCKFESIHFDLNNFKNAPQSALKKQLTQIRERMLRGS